MREAISGVHDDSTTWEPKPNDPALETEYLKRLMASLAVAESRATAGAPQAAQGLAAGAEAAPVASGQTSSKNDTKGDTKEAAIAARNAARAGQRNAEHNAAADEPAAPAEFMISEAYDNAWQHVGRALESSNFTIDDQDRTRGIYFIRYVDPKDMSSDEQGFWSQVFHGHKDKVAKVYRVNVRAITQTQTRVAIVDDKGTVDTSPAARQIMALITDQLK
jgi:outer membrane protein assembly factor BamC